MYQPDAGVKVTVLRGPNQAVAGDGWAVNAVNTCTYGTGTPGHPVGPTR